MIHNYKDIYGTMHGFETLFLGFESKHLQPLPNHTQIMDLHEHEEKNQRIEEKKCER